MLPCLLPWGQMQPTVPALTSPCLLPPARPHRGVLSCLVAAPHHRTPSIPYRAWGPAFIWGSPSTPSAPAQTALQGRHTALSRQHPNGAWLPTRVRGVQSCATPVLAEGGWAVGAKLLGLSGPVEAPPPRDWLVSRAPLITISCCPAHPAQRHCLLHWSR